MSDDAGPDVTLQTLHEDLRALTALIASGLRIVPPEFPGEVIRLLRETNRLNEERVVQLDVTMQERLVQIDATMRERLGQLDASMRERLGQLDVTIRELDVAIREQAREVHSILRTLAVGQQALSEDIRALVARIDALIRGRGDVDQRNDTSPRSR